MGSSSSKIHSIPPPPCPSTPLITDEDHFKYLWSIRKPGLINNELVCPSDQADLKANFLEYYIRWTQRTAHIERLSGPNFTVFLITFDYAIPRSDPLPTPLPPCPLDQRVVFHKRSMPMEPIAPPPLPTPLKPQSRYPKRISGSIISIKEKSSRTTSSLPPINELTMKCTGGEDEWRTGLLLLAMD